jgi:mRNA interferase RelE/StbE
LKELSRVSSKTRLNIENYLFEELPKLDSFTKSFNIEKMQGYQNYYKVRFGNYRVGIQIVNNEVFIERVLHRKEIYRYFP